MFEILLSGCLLANAQTCKDVRLNVFADTATARQCVAVGQFEAAKWIEGHPKWQVRRWSCSPAGTLAST